MRSRVALVLLTVWAAYAAVPTPKSYFGRETGDDSFVLDWDKVVGYFQVLAKSSDKIRVEELGKSADNRPFPAAPIAGPDTLRHLDRYIAIQRKLADPRRTTPAEAQRLFLEGKTVVLILCSIHATEIASTDTAAICSNPVLDQVRSPLASDGNRERLPNQMVEASAYTEAAPAVDRVVNGFFRGLITTSYLPRRRPAAMPRPDGALTIPAVQWGGFQRASLSGVENPGIANRQLGWTKRRPHPSRSKEAPIGEEGRRRAGAYFEPPSPLVVDGAVKTVPLW
jgi:hypothetical protein